MMRHDLAWLTTQGWNAACAAAQPEHRCALSAWQRNGWPAVVRRRDADAGADDVCLGIPLPPDPATGLKTRISLRVARQHIARVTPPLPLHAVLPSGALAAQAQMLQDAGSAGITLHVYGSLAMQTLTGQPYLTPSSDIDLLLYPASIAQLEAGLALLAARAELLPLDGEIVFPGGSAVAWREWLQARAKRSRVLVKDQLMVRLQEPAQLLALLEPLP